MTSSPPASLAVFTFDERPLALPVQTVERVVRAVEISPLVGAPDGVLGVVNVRGQILPVFDLSARFGWTSRSVRSTDLLVIAQAGQRLVGLLVSDALGVIEPADAPAISAGEILPGLETVAGAITLDGDIAMIYDLARFLSLEAESALSTALSN